MKTTVNSVEQRSAKIQESLHQHECQPFADCKKQVHHSLTGTNLHLKESKANKLTLIQSHKPCSPNSLLPRLERVVTAWQDTFNQQHDLTCCAGRTLCAHIPGLPCAAALLGFALPSAPLCEPSTEPADPQHPSLGQTQTHQHSQQCLSNSQPCLFNGSCLKHPLLLEAGSLLGRCTSLNSQRQGAEEGACLHQTSALSSAGVCACTLFCRQVIS